MGQDVENGVKHATQPVLYRLLVEELDFLKRKIPQDELDGLDCRNAIKC
jgi:hypothetical protein